MTDKKLALINARVFPGKGEDCQAVLISGDRIEALGSTAKIQALAGPGAETVDLGGRRVIPGFVDSHNHVLSGATLLTGVNCFGMTSIDEVKEAVARKAAELGPGEWVTGAGWIESQFKEGRMPNRKDLDEAAPHNPVVLGRLFAMVVANSKALELAGIGKGYVPVSGRVDLDESGEPTGILREGAQGLVRRMSQKSRTAPELGVSSGGDTESRLKLALNEYLKYGITSILDPGANVTLMRAYASLRAKGELPLRVTAMPAWHGIGMISGDASVLPAVEAGLQPGLGDEWLRIGNLKMASMGALAARRP